MNYDVGVFTRRRIISPAESYFAVPAAGAAFTPASLPNLLAWYKADANVYSDAGSTLATNGQGVERWGDQSHTYHANQTTGSGSELTYTTGALNSLPVLAGDNAGSRCVVTTENVPLGGTAISVFGVFKINTASGAARVVSIATTGSGDVGVDTFTVAATSTTAVSTYNSGFKGAQTVSSSTWNNIGSVFDGANNTMYVNGTGGTPVAATPTFASTVSIGIMGAGVAGGTCLDGSVAEVVITTDAMSAPNIALLQTYFTTKWGTLG